MAEGAHLAVVVGDENHRAQIEAAAVTRTFDELHAAEYLDRVRRGETGAASAYLGGLRRGSGVDPWRLLEVVAARALAVRTAGGVDGPGQEAAGTAAAEVPVSAAGPDGEDGHGGEAEAR